MPPVAQDTSTTIETVATDVGATDPNPAGADQTAGDAQPKGYGSHTADGLLSFLNARGAESGADAGEQGEASEVEAGSPDADGTGAQAAVNVPGQESAGEQAAATPAVADLLKLVQAQGEQMAQMMEMFRSGGFPPAKVADAPPAAPAQKDPWQLPAVERERNRARAELGDVSDDLADRYAETSVSLARWEQYANSSNADTKAQAQKAIAMNRQEMQAIAREAAYERRIAELEQWKTLQENAPQTRAHVEQTQSQVVAMFKPETLERAQYPNLARAAKAGVITAEKAYAGLDFSGVNMSDPDSFSAIDARLSLLDGLFADGGLSASGATVPAQQQPQTKQSSADNSVRVRNPGGIAIPHGEPEPAKPRGYVQRDDASGFAKYFAARVGGRGAN